MKLRVLPIAITGVGLLLALKASGLLLTGHYAFEEEAAKPVVTAVERTYRPSAAARTYNSWSGQYDPIVTGSVPQKKETPAPEPAAAAAPPAAEQAPADAETKPETPSLDSSAERMKDIQDKDPSELSNAEKALLDRLQSRRHELDARAQELDLRENLLRAAEKKIEDQISELKAVEERLAAAEAARKAEEDKKLKDLVTMYENMKPKQAAAIFDRLEMKVLVDVTTQMNPKKTSDIIARMEPAAAERLTVALARRDMAKTVQASPDALPKIEGAKQP
jgi:flagellar motility protein MotE (MotC chaperone)